MTHWLLLSVTIVLTAVANLLLKYAAVNRQEGKAEGLIESLWALFTTPSLVMGIACLGLGVIAYAIALRNLNLSVAYPVMTTSVVVLVAFFSAIFFGESISLTKVVGTVMVIAGVVFLSQS